MSSCGTTPTNWTAPASSRALARALGADETPVRHRALDDLAGTWRDDPEFEQALAALHQVDESLWR